MNGRTRRLFDRITLQRQTVLDELAGLGPEQLAFRPEPGSWSVLDVLEHLVRVEEGIMSRIRKRDPRTWGEAVRTRGALELMSLYYLIGRRFRVPIETVMPLGGVTLSDLGARWEAAQATMRGVLEGFGPDDFRRPMMRHPMLGRLTPVETLSFICRHIAHHRRQIARIRRALQ
jgi:DinB superfamily